MSQLNDNLTEILRQKDTYLLPANLKKDVSLLGVTGTYEGTDTSDATATADDILRNKTAYVDGEKITGTMLLSDLTMRFYDRDIDDFSLDTGYGIEYEGTYNTYGDNECINNPTMSMYISPDILRVLYAITPNKILNGQEIVGVIGTATSDATATANDIMKNKTAYVNGQKITGTNEGGVMTQAEYDEAVATLDDLLTGDYQEVYNVMNEVTDTPEDLYNGVGGTPTQIENTIDALLGVNN